MLACPGLVRAYRRAASRFWKELTEQKSREGHLTLSNGKEMLIHLPVQKNSIQG